MRLIWLMCRPRLLSSDSVLFEGLCPSRCALTPEFSGKVKERAMAGTKLPELHFICGKIGSGKSALAVKLGQAAGTIVVSQDVWLSALFADELKTGADYLRCTTRLNDAMAPHVRALLA